MLFGKENEKYFQDICKNITSRNIKGSAILKRPEDAIEYPEWAGRMPVFPEGTMASANPEGGWAASGTAVERMMQWFTDLGGKIVPGQVVDDFIYAPNENRVRGVKTKGGNEFHADLVVLAAGGAVFYRNRSFLAQSFVFDST